ncbi:MAG: ABC transporter permease [Acidobacteriota bacterium]|nr:ABC transporter permease [Acidobacteriota bacterium]
MRTLLQDLRFAARVLWKSPGVSAVAVVALTLGIGANTAIFSVVNAVLLRPLPYKDPERLVRLSEDSERVPQMSVAYPNFLDWREQQTVFEQMAAMQLQSYNLSGGGEAERLSGRNVSPEFFSVLGVAPALGRTFTEEENARGRERVVVLSHGLWQRRFGGDKGILGRAVTLNGEPFTVVGVLPRGFLYGSPTDVFVPIGSALDEMMMSSRGYHPGIYVLARLKDGVGLERAREEMKAIAARLAAQYPASNSGNTVRMQPLGEYFVGEIRPSLLILLAAVGMVLLIACANVANLLLARAAARGREIAIRTALGASRLRIVRQLLTESVTLALAGGVCGLLLALWGVDLLRSLTADNLPPTAEVGLDANVLLFTLAVSLVTGVAFGLAPALQASRMDLNTSLKEGGRSQSGGVGRQRMRNILVVAEVALSLLLLIGAGLMLKSFFRLRQAEIGFNPQNLLTMQVSRTVGKGEDPARAAAFFDQLRERLEATPGVGAAAYTGGMPMLGAPDTSVMVAGRPAPEPGKAPQAVLFITSPGYLEAMGIRLVRGRFFDEHDDANSQLVAVVDEAFARIIFPGEDPVGQRLKGGGDVPDAEIVGVVEHVNNYGLNVPEAVQPQLYYAFKQVPKNYMADALGNVYVAVRTSGDPAALVPAVRREAQALDPAQPLYNINTMEEVLAQSVATQKLSMLLLGLFAGVALALAAVGLYGVMSYTVTQRRHEIGVRMALGARPSDVLRMVVGQGMLLTAVGIGVGLLGALAATRLMASLLYGVSATDPATFAGIPLVLASVALAANYIPARRAMKVDPMEALRYE